MKGFSQFLVEAETSQAAAQAKRLQLTSDGHGGWTDRTGKYVAKTEGGKLVFFKGREKAGEEEPEAKRKPAPEPIKRKVSPKQLEDPKATKTKDPDLKTPEGTKKPDEVDQAESDTVTVAFGRFNPPTIGHEKLMKAADKVAMGGPLKIYPSRTQDAKKNPLDPDMKISFMKKLFPDYEENIINDGEMKSIFNVLIAADEEGYKNVNIVVGADRQAEFENLATKYNGELYNFKDIRVVSAGIRDADAEGVEGMSASKMRKAVVDGNFKAFKSGTPKNIKDDDLDSAYKQKKRCAEQIENIFKNFDFLALPSAQLFPFDKNQQFPEKINSFQLDTYHRWLEIFILSSLLELPTFTIPVGFDELGMPMGMQIIGKRKNDLQLFAFAKKYEEIFNFSKFKPLLD